MNGGVGYSWFRLILVDEEKQYLQLEGRLQEEQELSGSVNDIHKLTGNMQEHQIAVNLKETNLIGILREQQLIGVIGGGEDE